jgi:hypothetical protein
MDFYVAPLLLQVFGDQPAVALVRSFLTAEQAGALQLGLRKFILDVAGFHEIQKLDFVFGPDTLLPFVGVEHFFGGSEVRDVEIVDVADGFCEIAKILFFGEGSELGNVVETNIDQAFYAGVGQAGEENFRGLFCEADGEEFHREKAPA